MACERKARFRHNTIAFWLSDEEKKEVEARIILSGLPKGEYYRRSILGQEIQVVAGNYMSVRVANDLEQIMELIKNGTDADDTPLPNLIRQLLEINRKILDKENKEGTSDRKGEHE